MEDVDMIPVLRQFIRRELAPDYSETDLGDDVSLLESGVLDSFGIMTLLSFIEERFRVTIPVEQIEPSNFDSVAAISSLIEQVKNHA